jgi:hypothetical protein
LLRASDGNSYVTKFQNNPQHIRVLANEMLATRLGLALGLPMPRVEVIEVSDWLIEHTEDLRMILAVREFGAKRQAIGIALRGLPGHDAGLLATGISYGGPATWQTSPERSSWNPTGKVAIRAEENSRYANLPCSLCDYIFFRFPVP